MKKFINAPDDIVREALIGVAAAHPELRVDFDSRVIFRAAPSRPGKVAVVSGGGSGHEPLHSGFVGVGMLDAACAGEVFTSPPADRILAATLGVDAGAGVLYLIKNYTGDVMNFEMAAELAGDAGIRVASVLVADDVAVEDSTWTAGRRGVGGTVLVEKVAGAAAELGHDLDSVHSIAQKASTRVRSMGIALAGGTVPSAGKPNFVLGDDEMEFGVGIHGEPGRHRVSMAPAREIAEMIVGPVLAELTSGGPSIVMVNGLGATPLLELYLMFGEIRPLLERAGVEVARSLVGNFVTSLEMTGCSLTVLPADEELLRLWDAPVSTPGLRWGI